MCGLCGFARHPDSDKYDEAVRVLTALLVKNQSRGKHATGVASMWADGQMLVEKKAVDATLFTKATPYAQFMQMTNENASPMAVMGHTRNSTHRHNAFHDNAAHPFHHGDVVGGHNGVISNWREVETTLRTLDEKAKRPAMEPWVNDSQAAFEMLSRESDPTKALDDLDGWWALAWFRKGKLLMCRTSTDLHAAYVPEWRTLFWSSTEVMLKSTLDEHGLQGKYDLWMLKPNTIYRYNPKKFDGQSAHAERKEALFRGLRGRGNAGLKAITDGKTSVTAPPPAPRIRVTGGPGWDPYRAIERQPDLKRHRSLGARNAESEMDRVWDFVAKLNQEVTVCRAEIAHLYAVLNEKAPESFDYPSCDAEVDTSQLDALAVCVECGQADDGTFLRLPDNGMIHSRCVMPPHTRVRG